MNRQTKQPGDPVKGSQTGRPVMVLLDKLSQRWTLRILWELRDQRLTFRELQERCDNVSPTMLNKRLKELRSLQILDHDERGYGFTTLGKSLGDQLLNLDKWASRWAKSLDRH